MLQTLFLQVVISRRKCYRRDEDATNKISLILLKVILKFCIIAKVFILKSSGAIAKFRELVADADLAKLVSRLWRLCPKATICLRYFLFRKYKMSIRMFSCKVDPITFIMI